MQVPCLCYVQSTWTHNATCAIAATYAKAVRGQDPRYVDWLEYTK